MDVGPTQVPWSCDAGIIVHAVNSSAPPTTASVTLSANVPAVGPLRVISTLSAAPVSRLRATSSTVASEPGKPATVAP